MPAPRISLRASAPLAKSSAQLGPLSELAGTWVGSGFDLIALPTHTPREGFRLKLNATRETLEFNPIGGQVPDRGLKQDDIFLAGLAYLQRVSDDPTNEALHIETGMWLHVPATSVPPSPATVVRSGTVPHGDSLLAQGDSLVVNGGPQIDPVSSKPTLVDKTKQFPLGYLDPYLNPTLPAGIPQGAVANPNLVLTQAIQGQKIVRTVVLQVNSVPAGGIVNIPFIVQNANATTISAIFWIETVKQPDGTTFLQLQYTQTVVLNFLGIDWPHISVATLVKQ